ncbi:hypothetical protein ACFL23_04890 [Patescibacteria group bacterium]
MDNEEKNRSEIDLSHKFSNSSEQGILRENQPKYFFSPGTPKIVRLTVKYSRGLIKNENQANYVLLGFVVVAVIISMFLFFGGSKENLTPKEKLFLDTPPSQYNP